MSCLFNSLSYFCDYKTEEVRQIICNYMEKDPYLSSGMKTSTTIQYLEDKNLKNYLETMRSSSTWGGAPEIKAFVNLTKTTVWVRNISSSKSNYIRFSYDLSNEEEKNNKNVKVKNLYSDRIEVTWNGGHYEPVRQ
jgi:hypothetical protein